MDGWMEYKTSSLIFTPLLNSRHVFTGEFRSTAEINLRIYKILTLCFHNMYLYFWQVLWPKFPQRGCLNHIEVIYSLVVFSVVFEPFFFFNLNLICLSRIVGNICFIKHRHFPIIFAPPLICLCSPTCQGYSLPLIFAPAQGGTIGIY